MSGSTVKTVGGIFIVLSIILGVILGGIFPVITLDKYRPETVFNGGLMISIWASGSLLGFLVMALGTLIENQESMNAYLSCIYSQQLKDTDKNIVEDTSNKWQCSKCGTYNMNYSAVCKECEHSRY